jgi:hypothetical protein
MLYRRPLMPHPGGWEWMQQFNYFFFSSPARKSGVIDFQINLIWAYFPDRRKSGHGSPIHGNNLSGYKIGKA